MATAPNMEANQPILVPECTLAQMDAQSKKRVLEIASERLAAIYPDLGAREILDALLTRERLGSTALGDGVAIPHCRIECDHIVGACLTLESAIDFDAPDDGLVNLIFVLVVPNTETERHLEVLADLADTFSDADNREALVSASRDDTLYALMSEFLT